MNRRNRNEDWILLAVGIAIVLFGVWVLLGRFATPFLEPVRVALSIIRLVSLPLLLVAAGVLLILLATRRDLFVRPDDRRLYRSRSERMVTGVLGGVSDYFGWEVVLVRIIYVLLAVVTGFWPLLFAYIIASIAIPEEPPSATIIPPAWPTQPTYTTPGPPPQPYTPPAPMTPPQPSAPPTAPSVPEIPAPGIPVPPGQAYPPQAAVPEEAPAPPAPEAPSQPPASD